MLNDIKAEVLQLIQATNNEELLHLVKADIEFFSKSEKGRISNESASKNAFKITS